MNKKILLFTISACVLILIVLYFTVIQKNATKINNLTRELDSINNKLTQLDKPQIKIDEFNFDSGVIGLSWLSTVDSIHFILSRTQDFKLIERISNKDKSANLSKFSGGYFHGYKLKESYFHYNKHDQFIMASLEIVSKNKKDGSFIADTLINNISRIYYTPTVNSKTYTWKRGSLEIEIVNNETPFDNSVGLTISRL